MRPVGQAGRFQVLGEVEPAPRQIIERLTTLRESVQQRGLEALHERATQTRVEAQTLNARQQEKRAALHETLPTAYDRVAGDFLADADDFD